MPTKYHLPDPEPGDPKQKFDAIGYLDENLNKSESFTGKYATFWFADISIGTGPLPFDSSHASLFDYKKFFEITKELSGYRLSELLKDNLRDNFLKSRSFHRVNVGKYKFLQSVINKMFNTKGIFLDDLTCPFIYQIALYNSDECLEPAERRKKAPRIFFRLTNEGVYSVFFLDLYHECCPATDLSSH